MQICDLNIYIYKIQIVQKSYGQKQVIKITIMQEYCVRKTQAKCKMTEKKQVMEIPYSVK